MKHVSGFFSILFYCYQIITLTGNNFSYDFMRVITRCPSNYFLESTCQHELDLVGQEL